MIYHNTMNYKNNSRNNSISIIIPVYNEEEIIEKVLYDIHNIIINNYNGTYEVIIINDGSNDLTGEILTHIKEKFQYIKVIENKKNLGHGPSLLKGFKEAKNEFIFHIDGDNQFDIRDFWKLYEYISKKNIDIIFGYRYKRNDPLYRIVLSKIINIFILLFFGVYLKDSNVPFKIIRNKPLKKLLKIISENTLAPSIFISILSKKLNFKIKELPIKHFRRKTGKISLPSTKLLKFCIKGFWELIKFKFLLLRLKKNKKYKFQS